MAVATKQDKLRELREEQLKAQQQVAQDAGIALFTYQRAERGDKMSPTTLRKIARALGVALEDLVREEELAGSPKVEAQEEAGQREAEAEDRLQHVRNQRGYLNVQAKRWLQALPTLPDKAEVEIATNLTESVLADVEDPKTGSEFMEQKALLFAYERLVKLLFAIDRAEEQEEQEETREETEKLVREVTEKLERR
jgi:DNA-binding XRE family transcriptional regulator